jgi:hypothetical protein
METLSLWTWFAGAFVPGLVPVCGVMRDRRPTHGDRIPTNGANRANYPEKDRRSGA